MKRVTALLALLSLTAFAEDPNTPPPADQRAACMKECAGSPKDANGEKLIACIKKCETPRTEK